jgi:mannose-6-phosphate isomerase-like protein (cupin superfamily)
MKKLNEKRVHRIATPASATRDEFLRETDLPENAHGRILGESTPVQPSADLRARLLDRVELTSRFTDFAARLSELVEVSLAEAHGLLLSIDNPAAWGPGPFENVSLLHFAGGPSVTSAITGFVRLERGTGFPTHEHVGRETVVVLQGSFRDEDGAVHGPGDKIDLPAGSEHEFIAVGPLPLIYLTIIFDGVRIGDTVIAPGDPRA